MNDIYENILKIREQLEQEAGPFFSALSTPETWKELVRWLLEHPSGDYQQQMSEIAAMAMLALEASQEDAHSMPDADTFPNAASSNLRHFPNSQHDFGPLDLPIYLRASRRHFF